MSSKCILCYFAYVIVLYIQISVNAGFCEHGNEPSCSIKGGEFLD